MIAITRCSPGSKPSTRNSIWPRPQVNDPRYTRRNRVTQGCKIAVHEEVMVTGTGLVDVRGGDRDPAGFQADRYIGTGELSTFERSDDRDTGRLALLACTTGRETDDKGEG